MALMLAASSVSAATWYLSPAGSDNNAGTTTNTALATIAEAQTKAASGDIVQIMAGTYNLATNVYNSVQDGVYASVNLINKNGITYEAMPGTRPVFNFSGVNPSGLRTAAFWVTATGVTFQGFDVVGVQENITTANNQSLGFGVWGCKNCTWNQVNVHDADCVGFYAEEVAANNLFYRCDSYDNAGINSFSYGNADGFGCHPAAGGTNNIFRECRSWNNSDDGYDCINAAETVTFDHCWSYMNGNNGGNGNGFKVGGWGSQPQNEIPNPLPAHVVFNCLSAFNSSHGFYANHQPGRAAYWTNNTSYDNSGADFDMLERNPPDYATNIDQTDSNDISGTNEVMHCNLGYAGYATTGDYNETGSPLTTSNSWSEAGVTVGTADFLSTAYAQMTNARLANGALPVITFMHLTATGATALTNLGCFIAPPVPAGLTANATNTQVALSWTASPGAYGYNVYRSTTSGGTYTNIALWVTNNSYLDTGLGNGTTNYYEITAVNPGDESTNSARAIAIAAPAAPAGLTATGGVEQVVLSWNASAGAVSYNVKRSTTSSGPYATNASLAGTNYLDTGLTSGATYYYVVSAVNAAGQSTNSIQAGATTIPPAPPQFSGITVSGAGVVFSGAGGVTNGTYYVMGSTNLNLPVAQWPRLATNSFDANGGFNFTNVPSAGMLQQFYLLELP
jgi:hypothetical protein